MKGLKTILSIALMLCVAILFGQNQPRQSTFKYGFIPKKSTKTINYVVKSTNETLDTAGLSQNFVPEFSPNTYMFTYGLIDIVNGDTIDLGYWFGVNADSMDGWAQCYDLYEVNQVGIKGVLMIFGGKFDTDGNNNSTLKAYVTPMKANACITNVINDVPQYGPGPDLINAYANVSIPISEIDTTNLFTYKELSQIKLVTEKFCIVTDFSDLREKGDTAYLLCDDIGDGKNMNYTQLTWGPVGYYNWISTKYGAGLDVNISLFAVVDLDYVNINTNSYFDGMQLTFPNITREPELVIQFALKNASNTSIDIISLNGQLVKSEDLGMKEAGSHHTIMDISNLQPGMYLVSLNSQGSRLIKKLVIE